MKKILLLSILLIAGCEGLTNFVNKEGICILRDITIPKILCFPQVTESTCYGNTNDNLTFIDWKQNRGVFFSRKERETWHTYKGDGINNRVALVYNLNTYRIKEVYRIEKKNYLFGILRYKINPYLLQYFKFTI